MKKIINYTILVFILLGFTQCDDKPTSSPYTIDRYSYGSDARQHMDLYVPKTHDANTPVVFLVHGGAWVLGPNNADKGQGFKNGLNLIKQFTDEGYACAVVKYRLACYTANEANLNGNPGQYTGDMVQDISSAVTYVKQNAGTLGVSSNRFAVVGESAGSHISLLYSLGASSDPSVKAVISLYGPTDFNDSQFKTNANSSPWNSVPVINPIVMRQGNNCNYSVGGTSNFLWALRSLVGTKILPNQASSVVDVINPVNPNNISRNLPTLIIHSDDDILIPGYHADNMLAAINNEFGTGVCAPNDFSCDHKMIKYPNTGHGRSGGDKALMRLNIVTWLQNHL